jgi:hypothetical protein
MDELYMNVTTGETLSFDDVVEEWDNQIDYDDLVQEFVDSYNSTDIWEMLPENVKENVWDNALQIYFESNYVLVENENENQTKERGNKNEKD